MKRCLYERCDSRARSTSSSGVGTKYLKRVAYGRRTKILKASVMRIGGQAAMASRHEVRMSVMARKGVVERQGRCRRVDCASALTENHEELHANEADQEPVDGTGEAERKESQRKALQAGAHAKTKQTHPFHMRPPDSTREP